MLIKYDEKRFDQQSEQEPSHPIAGTHLTEWRPPFGVCIAHSGTLRGDALISEHSHFLKRQLAFWHVAAQKASVCGFICLANALGPAATARNSRSERAHAGRQVVEWLEYGAAEFHTGVVTVFMYS